MNRSSAISKRMLVGLAALLACGAVAFGCGGDDDDDDSGATTTTTSAQQSTDQKIDSAVGSCTNSAQDLGGTGGTALESACKSVGRTAKQDVSSAGDDVSQGLSKAASSCRKAVNSLPSDAQSALSNLCDAIADAG